MTDKPISREKLEAFFRSAHQTTEGVDDPNRVLYITGRNILADAGFVSLKLGEFDDNVLQLKDLIKRS